MVIRRKKFGCDLIALLVKVLPGADGCDARAIALIARRKGETEWLPIPSSPCWMLALGECEKLDVR